VKAIQGEGRDKLISYYSLHMVPTWGFYGTTCSQSQGPSWSGTGNCHP